VDCASGQPATRVAVYDGPSSSSPYVADVSMEVVRPYTDACSGRSGSAQFGFRVIFDSNRLANGRHTLAFVATYPGGATQTATMDVFVENMVLAAYVSSGNSAVDQGHYWRHYDYPRNQCGYYGCYSAYSYPYSGIVAPVYTAPIYTAPVVTAPVYTGVTVYNPYPVYTTGVYRPCVLNPWGNCQTYLSYGTTPYSTPGIYPQSPYVWNGTQWVLLR
jgi:hypothetical protein